jgi:hypothetical protein
VTVVHAQIMRPDSTGTPKPARGYLRWAPVRGWSTAGNALILPLPFRVKLVNGAASVNVEATSLDWAWEVTYELAGLPHESRVYAVQDSSVVVELSALTEVRPLPGTPAKPLPENWTLTLAAAINAAVGPAVTAAMGAGVDASVQEGVAAAVPPAVSAAVAPILASINDTVTAAVGSQVSAALADALRTVTVTTGNEARPATTGSVSWIGGTVQPVNMASGDLWFKAVP